MYDVIRIKRRLPNSPLDTIPALSGGELFFNEKNSNLYYGASAGTISINQNGNLEIDGGFADTNYNGDLVIDGGNS